MAARAGATSVTSMSIQENLPSAMAATACWTETTCSFFGSNSKTDAKVVQPSSS
jgi:hypothetical protein